MKVSQLINNLQTKNSKGYADLTPNNNALDHIKMIYIVKRSHGWYKIGVTKNIENRIAQMQSYSPEKLSLVDAIPLEGLVYFVERAVLNTLKNNLPVNSTSGEWVKLQGDVEDVHDMFNLVVRTIVNSTRRSIRAENQRKAKLLATYGINLEQQPEVRIAFKK
tara:strand:+ start:699 stop:1187 length:489 start_codon:yes stop_codon:yes gene_type:complete